MFTSRFVLSEKCIGHIPIKKRYAVFLNMFSNKLKKTIRLLGENSIHNFYIIDVFLDLQKETIPEKDMVWIHNNARAIFGNHFMETYTMESGRSFNMYVSKYL